MQHVSSDPPISGNSGFNLLKLLHPRGFYVGAFDIERNCYRRNKLKPEIGGSGDTAI